MLDHFLLKLRYRIQGVEYALETSQSMVTEHLHVEMLTIIDTYGKRIKVKLCPKEILQITQAQISSAFAFDKNDFVFLNGYQSWTDSRELTRKDTLKSIGKFMKPLMNKYRFTQYGDYNFVNYPEKKGCFHGFTYAYVRRDCDFTLIGSLTERQGYTIFEMDMNQNAIEITKDVEGLDVAGDYQLFDLVILSGSEEIVFDHYFMKMGVEPPKSKPAIGWTSWYNYYQNIDEKTLKSHLDTFGADGKAIDIFQIDDGYQRAIGDWLDVDSGKFPSGMKAMAEQIHEKGFKAGIWLAPFVCETNSMIFREHQDWLLKTADGNLVAAGSNWSGFYALDLENSQVREYIRGVFKVVLDDWGYDLVKLDFLYGACIVPHGGKTRGQLMCEAMDFLRDCVGDKEILGCGVPLGPAFGKVDYCRIGCDVGLDWNDKWTHRRIHRERVSTLNAIGNSIGRRQLDGRAFLNDPDVFLLRNDRIELNWNQKKTLALVNLLFGKLMFTSDDISSYGPEQREWYDRAMGLASRQIISVTFPMKHLVTIRYRSLDQELLCLLNLSGKKLTAKKIQYLEDKTVLEAFESREFVIKP